MKKLLLLFVAALTFTACSNNDYSFEDSIKANSEKIFGVSFPSNQDWVSTSKMSIDVNLDGYSKVLILSSTDSILKVLNSSEKSGVIYFDTPDNFDNLYLAFVKESGEYYYKKIGSVDNLTRAKVGNYDLPDNELIINGTVETFANQRGWLPGEVFYTFDNQSFTSEDYSGDFKTMFNDIIFNYFPNGRAHDNLPQIKKSGYYNESAYPITTGDKPIIVSPIYKNDGGYHEISEAELYYYYYKGDRELSIQEIEALPKYRAIDLSTVYSNEENQVLAKSKSYALVYWGDKVPTDDTRGLYLFPKGYKIGFCYKSNTTTDNKKKQGEVYGDGRLNYNINKYGNFKSSNLEDTDPRMAWMSVNEKMFLCVESGTDKDFNDLILEVEGGIKPIIVIPDPPEYQSYTFCFEDQRLGDYDMNDVVVKGNRIDDTHVEWTLMATGATDELYIYNIEGEYINKDTEVHEIFGKPKGTFINTGKNGFVPFVTDIVVVDKKFSFLDATTQPYIYDKTRNWEVKVSRKGEDPHAIMIPYDFKWPLERVCIKDAYLDFNNWGMKLIEETDWFKYPVENLVY